MGTLLRLDSSKGYSPENVTIVPRIQFHAIEIARNREGLNNHITQQAQGGSGAKKKKKKKKKKNNNTQKEAEAEASKTTEGNLFLVIYTYIPIVFNIEHPVKSTKYVLSQYSSS